MKDGEKIDFLGDSITAGGWSSSTGYVHLVIIGLEANGVKATAIPAGVSGHKSNQMLARLQKDVLDKHPDWMTLSCGVNDVWHGTKGVPLDDAMASANTYVTGPNEPEKGTYEKNITAIIDQAMEAKIKPMILTATVIQEQLDNDLNKKLAPYNDFLRKLAAEKKVLLADLNAAFQERLKAENKPALKVLTRDGVHMNPEGDKVMAATILKAFGLDATEMKKAEEAWAKLPPAATPVPKAAATPVPLAPAK